MNNEWTGAGDVAKWVECMRPLTLIPLYYRCGGIAF